MRNGGPCFYYHATGGSLRVGTILTAKKSSRAGHFETMVDALRPKGAPSRASSFFLGSDPADLLALGAHSIKRIYNVQPVGTFLKADAAWVVRAAGVWDQDERTDELGPNSSKMIANYWAGKRSPWFAGWEIVAHQIRVCGKLDERERQAVVEETDRRHPGFVEERIMNRMIFGGLRSGKQLTREQIARDMGVSAAYPAERGRR